MRRLRLPKGPRAPGAERLQVSPTTARRWSDRYRRDGEAGMADLSSRSPTSATPNAPAPCADFQHAYTQVVTS
ncbi:helix-turn-helix domain-containing protein [Streptomyces sp. NPDC005303]|uniref:helix-turn-helix domain-containing protein n=1 Tax=Streptomyces sp. NPDC005303 TaxID=3155713 RepID=UPI0033A4C243